MVNCNEGTKLLADFLLADVLRRLSPPIQRGETLYCGFKVEDLRIQKFLFFKRLSQSFLDEKKYDTPESYDFVGRELNMHGLKNLKIT